MKLNCITKHYFKKRISIFQVCCFLSKECQQGQRHSNDRKRRTNHKSTQEPQRILRPKREHKRRRQRELQHLLLEQLLGFR